MASNEPHFSEVVQDTHSRKRTFNIHFYEMEIGFHDFGKHDMNQIQPWLFENERMNRSIKHMGFLTVNASLSTSAYYYILW